MDARRTACMIEKEEMARQRFETFKIALPGLSPRWWKKEFKGAIDEFIGECLNKKELATKVPSEDEEEEELERIYLHGLRRLVAGAVQEWELVQQPKHAETCAKLDGALVWQGRGYVIPILHAIPSLQPSLQN